MTLNAGFIGLGSMGAPMAMNLVKSGVKLFVFNRTKQKTAKLAEAGAEAVNSPKEILDKTSIVLSMVADDHALQEITEGPGGLLEGDRKGAIHVSMGTVSPKISQRLALKHQEKGISYLSCPVFGRPEAAAQRTLWLCLSGPLQAKKEVEPLLSLLGKKVYDFGEEAATANVLKLAGNFLILSIIESMGEAFAFAEKNGAPVHSFHSFLSETLFSSPIFLNYGRLILSRQFQPAGFKMSLGLKDIDLLLRTADASRVPLPVAGALHDRLMAGLAKDRSDFDWSAIILTEREEAGLESG